MDPVQELDAVRRHICHILGFDLGIIDVLRPDGLVKLLTFTIDEPEDEQDYSLDTLEDSNGESLSDPNSEVCREVLKTQFSHIGTCKLKKRAGEEVEDGEFPYVVVPIIEGYDNRWVVKGVLRLVSFDETRDISVDDMQTLKIVGQHLSSRLASLALSVLRSQDQNAKLADFDLKHICVVHTNRVVRRRLSRTLQSAYRVTEFDDATKFIESVTTTPADAVIIDAEMKDSDGESLYKKLRQIQETKYISLVVVTTETGTVSRLDCLSGGADDCIDENCVDAEILARVRTLLRVKKTERELAMQLKLMEDYTKRLEQVGEKEREANAKISRTYEELELKSSELAQKQREAEIRRSQDGLLHRLSDTLRRSFNIEENVSQMLEDLAGYSHLDCCFVILPSEDEPSDSIRLEYCSDPSYSLMDKDRDLALLELFREHCNPEDDVFISDVVREKKADPFRKDVLSNYHIYSLFYLPISYEGKLHGILGGHKCESDQIWSMDNQNFLRQVADQLSTAVTTARLYKRVERQATTDGLTTLFNHRTGQEKLAEQLKLAERYGRNVCAVMLDVDHFKSINDTYGHPVGDTVLRMVAHIIKRDCRDVDIPVRYGGEEFLIVLPEVNIEGARVVAERLRKTLNREEITHENIQLKVSASLGVACYPEDADNQHQLLELADKALYMSKRKGRNQVHVAGELKFKELSRPEPPLLPVAPDDGVSATQGHESHPHGAAEQAAHANPHAAGQDSHAHGQDPSDHGQDPHAHGQDPHAQEQDPHAQEQAPHAHGQDPHAQEQAPHAHGQDPHAHGQAPHAQEQAPHAHSHGLHGQEGIPREQPQAPQRPAQTAQSSASSQGGESLLVPEVVETVKKMAGALYSKSEYNKVHHLETARFAEMVAKVLGLSAKQVEQIRVASLLHDVGLLHVPEDIINKKGQVTADELKLLMQHPTLGAEMLRTVPALREICDILEHHHECWDGTGYPRGLKGDEIPLAARIVAIVEAYHAMISERPYRPAMSTEKARRVLKSQAGSQFDPFLVDIFLAVLAELEQRE